MGSTPHPCLFSGCDLAIFNSIAWRWPVRCYDKPMNDPSSPATRRLFIAVMPPAAVQEALARLPATLLAHRNILRVVRPEALHVTLHFLGQQSPEQERQAAAACAAAVAGESAFSLTIGGYGAFPDARRPRVVWLGVQAGAERLIVVQRRVEDELLHRGIIARREDFTPHLTLARVRPEATPAARAALGRTLFTLPGDQQAHCNADAISLVHSALTPQGSRYTILERWPFTASDH